MAIEDVAIAVEIDVIDLVTDAVVFGVPAVKPSRATDFDGMPNRELKK
jgi:hypothetical protein